MVDLNLRFEQFRLIESTNRQFHAARMMIGEGVPHFAQKPR